MKPRKTLKKVFIAVAAAITLTLGAGAPLVIDHIMNPPQPPSPLTSIQDSDGMTVDSDGNKSWWQNKKLHRLDGPAIEWADGTKEWWVNGDRHRDDGPAIEWADGSKAWYKNGEIMAEEQFIASRMPSNQNPPYFRY